MATPSRKVRKPRSIIWRYALHDGFNDGALFFPSKGKGGVLDYNNPYKTRYHLVVSDNELRGFYDNYVNPSLSRNDVTWTCGGSIKQVIVPK
jgi:hypothetical protein